MKNKKVKIIEDKNPVIYKQDIMDENGKLNTVGVFLLLGAVMGAINIVCKYLSQNIIDKDKVN